MFDLFIYLILVLCVVFWVLGDIVGVVKMLGWDVVWSVLVI